MLVKLRIALGRRLRALAELRSPRELFSAFYIFGLALFVTTALRLKLSKPLLNWLKGRQAGELKASDEHLRRIVQRTDRVLLLGRPLIRTECLTRSCLLYYQMKRAGADVNVRFGTAAEETGLRFHCWLLIDDQPAYEQFDPRVRYRQLYDLHS